MAIPFQTQLIQKPKQGQAWLVLGWEKTDGLGRLDCSSDNSVLKWKCIYFLECFCSLFCNNCTELIMHFLLSARRLSCLNMSKFLTICENKIFACFYKIEKIKTLFFLANSAEDTLRGHLCPPSTY